PSPPTHNRPCAAASRRTPEVARHAQGGGHVTLPTHNRPRDGKRRQAAALQRLPATRKGGGV
ncbi:MAG: hypothetical protein FWH21_02930, partial [Kiritimatiellaeota bacterium]|nr:hypothetical protein [Kiritimatiellota bacterium]